MKTALAILALLAFAGTGAAAVPHGPRGVPAYATQRSYQPNDVMRLVIARREGALTAQVFQAGPEKHATWSHDVMKGVPIGKVFRVTSRIASVRIGATWPTGLYFVRLRARDGRVGYAPFVVRPPQLGEHAVAVVLSTNTWAAYNYEDDDGDGAADSWYANPREQSVLLTRPYDHRGVPPHFVDYDAGFVRWLAHTGKEVDFLTDDDLERVSGDALARAYALIVFPGHEEYVTPHEYDAIERFRNRGGNLAFLSANNFFYRVIRRGNRIFREGRWRDLGRPEAALVGVQYLDWNHNRYPNGPYIVNGAGRAPWLFAGTGLRQGSRFGTYGIEIDARTPASPRGIQVVARVPNLFGRGRSAEMTYYETPAGARVFAAGTINFGGSAEWKPVPAMLENLWRRLARP